MALYDVFMLLVLIYCLAHGAWKGMTWQIAPIASLIVGYVVAYPLSAQVAPYMGASPMNRLVALLVLYLCVSFGVYLLVRSLRSYIEKLKMQEFDRHLGVLLGAVRGTLLAVVITFFLVAMSPSARDYILTTRSGFAAAVVMDRLHVVLPETFHEKLEPYIHTLDETFDEHGYTPVHNHYGPELPEGLADAHDHQGEEVGDQIEHFLSDHFLDPALRSAGDRIASDLTAEPE